MKHAYIILICLMVAGVACKKRRTDPANELHYKETQCANPWDHQTVAPESDTLKIKNWLLENDITALRITITDYLNVATCKACTCPSTRIVQVSFNNGDLNKAKALGFYQP
ncbi:hypothetical protein GFS24_24195 [Chitinophaga sp. SYP-B3965]|uniref:hypothetical protein n=1 Tax=Chitinophaga sp. SYP-B3965 TaxID=2663120 RepID=UPI001299F0C6|nr:hypothetical protein [Chitinophaga sp. SYP-B3965]MRG48243.1 hypothetical protein [Chitinophaga sp. SYP-B3965]